MRPGGVCMTANSRFVCARKEMIAGAVAPARMDLRNQELVKAHLYSTWLATTGLSLGRWIAEILDLNTPNFPIAVDPAAQLDGPNRDIRFREAVERAQQIIKRTQDIRNAAWFSDNWIEDTIRSAPEALDRAFDRWRELYQATCALRDAARRVVDDPHASRKDREEAERREAEARREISLLLNRTNRQEESDFYPYRYLAGEGFLPGYNFPRLPVRASVTVGNNAQMIDRPRFLGLTEFGPWNRVYHEGRKHRVYATILPPAGIEGRLTRARLCNMCGCAHAGADTDVELCEHCGTRLDAATSDFPQRLLDQPMMRARPSERISSEEEERVHAFGASIMDGWKRSDRAGFTIDPQTGQWGGRNEADDFEDDPAIAGPLTGVKPYVRDFRNILLLQPRYGASSDDFQTTLLHAIKRAVQFVYQVEDQESGCAAVAWRKVWKQPWAAGNNSTGGGGNWMAQGRLA